MENEELAELNVLAQFNVQGITSEELQIEQNNDSNVKTIMNKLLNRDPKIMSTYVFDGGLVYRKHDHLKLLLVPDAIKKNVLEQYHSQSLGGHMARDRLYDILKLRFYWRGMAGDISEFLNNCELCLKIKSRVNLRHGALRPIRAGKPFELVGTDIAYLPKSRSGFRYVLVAIDYFTNWVEAAVMKSLTADELIRTFFKIIICRHGCPEGIMSDSGSQLKSKAFIELCKCFNISKIESSPYHQQANGKVEKFIGFLKRALALVTDRDRLDRWDEMVDHCLFIYRITINRTLADTPFYLMYGRDALLPQDLKFHVHDNRRIIGQDDSNIENYQYTLSKTLQREYLKLLENRVDEQNKYKAYYDLDHYDVVYSTGDRVLVLYDTPVKSCLMPKWEGPFSVLEQIDPVTYRVEDATRITTVHVQRMKLLTTSRRTKLELEKQENNREKVVKSRPAKPEERESDSVKLGERV